MLKLFVLLLFSSIKNQLAFTGTEAAPKHLQLSHHTVSTMGSPQEKQDVLLPPSAFMTTALEDTVMIAFVTWTNISVK